MKGLGIEVIFEKDNIKSLDESGELLITLLAAFAQAESQSASENQRWRIKKMFEQGRPNTGRMLGYRLHDGQLVIVPEEVEIVREIFSCYLDGMGMIAIAKRLNEKHLYTINNHPWGHTSIHRVLTNEKYTGNMLLQKTYHRDYMDHNSYINKGERTSYFVENSHEAIISQGLFDAVQEELLQRGLRGRNGSHAPVRHLFAGYLVCKKCGKCYKYSIYGRHTKYEKPIWVCSTFKSLGKDYCNNKRISESILQECTMTALGVDNADDLPAAMDSMLEKIYAAENNTLIYPITRYLSWNGTWST